MHQKSALEKPNLFNAPSLMQKFYTSAPSDLGGNQLFNSSTPNGQEAPIAIIAGG
jgi:hypothetical protein